MDPAPRPATSAPATGGPRPWLGVRFVCGGAYIRVYRRPEDPAYVARCPRCAECVRFRVGPGGDNARLFDVDCGLRPR